MHARSELVLNDEPDAVPTARRFTAKALSSEFGNVVEDAELVVTELVTNAMLHGRSPITLRILREDDGLRLEVQDAGPALPMRGRPNPDAMTGRGLTLVAALSSAWGIERSEAGGKVVWAELGDGGESPPTATRDLEVEELLEVWGDIETEEVHYPVRLGAVPTDLLLAAKSHIDNVVREFALVKADEAISGVEIPGPMARLVQTVTTDFAEARAEIKRQAFAAAARDDAETELVLSLPLSAADAGERYLAALDEADRYARAARLLTVAAPEPHRIFRRWYVQSLVDQLRAVAAGEAMPEPTPLPNHTLPRSGEDLAGGRG